MTKQRWEYCLLICTPMTGLDEGGSRIVYQLVEPDAVKDGESRTEEQLPQAAIGRLLNDLGQEGWELVTYDTSTNRGVFKRATD